METCEAAPYIVGVQKVVALAVIVLGAMLAIVVPVDTGTIPTPATAKAALPVSTPAASPISPSSAFAKRGKGGIVILPL